MVLPVYIESDVSRLFSLFLRVCAGGGESRCLGMTVHAAIEEGRAYQSLDKDLQCISTVNSEAVSAFHTCMMGNDGCGLSMLLLSVVRSLNSVRRQGG